ncbi:MAG: dipeptide/oligopeptide/nickel ABC transporter permease/ATP-binding protein [Spirochaetes bacterium]|nr:dipeptide/oligopeptide/nickel ABC transporter permease/ATP-binding protein [Spirochaetota bacterium]
MKHFFIYLKARPIGMASLVVLIILYTMMIFAEFFAPFSPTTSFADKSFHPPNVRFHQGRLAAQEMRVVNTVTLQYVRIRDHFSPVQFFAEGEPYLLWGVIPAQRRFLTTAPGEYPMFLMGTDNLGRDIFSRIVYGARISLTIGFVATAISLLLAALAGGLSGYFGGFTDWSIMRSAEFLMLIPTLYLILFLRSLMATNLDPGQSFMMITIILSLVGWPGTARMIRGMVHAIKREEFVLNAKLEMIPSVTIIFRHIIPQIASILIVSVALSIPGFIMTETVLSWLGLGITDPAVSWGSLINRDLSTISNLQAFPWLLSPVWFLIAVTLAFNFIGDALRDFFDPYHTAVRKRAKNGKGAAPSATAAAGVVQDDVPPPDGSIISVRNLTVDFAIPRGREQIFVQAVRGLSFSLEKGKTLGIVGESGSGKSVSTLAIPGLLSHNASVKGSILYEGTELNGMAVSDLRKYRGKKIGMIFQEPGRSYDPLQNMDSVFFETFRNRDKTITREESTARACELLAETGLENGAQRLSNFPHQFSGGQLQRIGIALALAQGCELLVADEPTTALDLTIQKQIIELLITLRGTRKLSIIFISHDIDLVAYISDRIMVMYGGLVMESGSAHDITENPWHPYTRALLAASPQFGSHYSQGRLQSIPGKVTDPSRPEPGCPFAPRCVMAKPECSVSVPPLETFTGAGGHVREIRCIAKELR